MVIDVWMQHQTLRFLSHDMFASLRRWTGAEIPDQAPGIEVTVGAMDTAGVDIGLLSAWSAPHQPSLPGAGARARPARHLLARQRERGGQPEHRPALACPCRAKMA